MCRKLMRGAKWQTIIQMVCLGISEKIEPFIWHIYYAYNVLCERYGVQISFGSSSIIYMEIICLGYEWTMA
jgi:hypothetical protein